MRYQTLSKGLALFIGLFAFTSSGCAIYTDSPDVVHVEKESYNYAPEAYLVEAGCYWDSYYGDYVWYFDAEVDDPNGWGDVMEVWADVYDEYTGEWIDSFYLEPMDEFYWTSAWLQGSTWLDYYYPYYVVDFVPYDYAGAYSITSVYPVFHP